MSQSIVIDNANQPLGELLNSELHVADEFLAVSAFLNSGGLSIIEDRLWNILQNEGRVSVIHGADFRITDSEAIRTLAKLKMHFAETMSHLVQLDWALMRSQSFHPKMYITTPDYQNYCAVIGSSNLTLGGLRNNTEVNVVISGGRTETPITQCLDIYESIRNSPSLIEPDVEFVEKYTRLHERAEAIPPPYADSSPDLTELYEELVDLIPKTELSTPRTRVDYVVQAMLNLVGDDNQRYLHLESVYVEAERLARSAGKQYVWSTFRNSVRGRINSNIAGRNGLELFVRRGGSAGQSGEYRLSEQGRTYGERLAG